MPSTWLTKILELPGTPSFSPLGGLRSKLLSAANIVGYALSPIDLIPDFIPVLGYLDDLVLIPLGITLALKMIPHDVLAECREKSQTIMSQSKPTNWVAAGVIIAIWFLLAALAIILIVRAIKVYWLFG